MTAGRITEAELQDVKTRNPCDQVAGRWVTLRRHGQKMIGPCPLHSGDPHARDSTSFECTADGWVCAVCADGGDVIHLVECVQNCSFLEAVAFLGGKREIDPAEAARAQKKRDEIRAQRERESRTFREKERRRLFDSFWHPAKPIAGSDVERYLERRRCPAPPTLPPRIRFLPSCPMYADGSSGSIEVHRGPAMLAAIVDAGGTFRGLHTTWLDLEQPKGKAAIADKVSGEILPAKKVRGSKSGGRIELVPRATPRRLVIGEGIETVLSVFNALTELGQDLSETAFWSAVDLGNLGGKAAGSVPHPALRTANDRALRVPGPVPDLEAPGLAIPESVEEIVLLGDADSDRFSTECALVRAAVRFAKPNRIVRAAWAHPGQDFNDMMLAELGAVTIGRVIDGAVAPIAPPVADPAPRSPSSTKKKSKPTQPRGTGGDPPREGGGGSSEPDDDDLNRRLAFYPQTDLGNAERFRDRKRGAIYYNEAIGWLAWDHRRWSRDRAAAVVKRAEHSIARAIQLEAKALLGTDKDVKLGVERDGSPIMLSGKLKKWGRSSEAANKLNAISKHAAAYMEVATAELDADRFAINVENGTLRIRRDPEADCITFQKHEQKDLITKLAPVHYDPAATCPLFDKFLAEVQPRETSRRFLMQWFGLSLTGDTSEQKLVFNYGKGKNGKSTLLEAIANVAGDYGKALPIETFLDQGRARNAGQATPDLAILPGVRLLRTSEPERGAKLAEALIKLATGGDPIQARHLNRDYFEFVPQFKLTMSGNYRPKIEGVDEGIWRRVVLVPWDVTVEKPDRNLLEKLKTEGSGILNRLLDGIRDWLDNGLILPDEVVKATAAFRSDSDPIGRFLEVCTVADNGSRVQGSELYKVFVAWAKANGERESTNTYFGRSLADHGIIKKVSHLNYWLGIRLVKGVDDFVDHEGNPLRQAETPAGAAAQSEGDEFKA